MKRLLALGAAITALAMGQSAAVNPPVNPRLEADQPYGFQLGTIAGSAAFGAAHLGDLSGMHPAVAGSLDIGLHKYLGVFAEGGWSHAGASACYGFTCASATVNFYSVSGGLEIVASNHSRIVPYTKLGFGYADGRASAKLNGFTVASGSGGAPAVRFGGGVRAYLTHHIAIDAQLSALRTIPSGGGGANIIVPTVGVIFQSK